MTMPTIAALLEEYRQAHGGLSDYAAAATAGVSQSLYQRWRTGHVVPGDEQAELLAAFLGRPQGEIESILAESRRQRRRMLKELEDLRHETERLRRRVVELESRQG